MSVNREGPVPAERLEALADRWDERVRASFPTRDSISGEAMELRSLLAEAREEVKPSLQDMRRFAPAMTEAVYDALVRDAMNWRTQQKALSASAGTEGPGLGSEERFICHMICCGLDDGYIAFATWDDADKFRESYTSGVAVAKHGYSAAPDESGHKRAVIVSQGPWSDPLGVWRSALAALRASPSAPSEGVDQTEALAGIVFNSDGEEIGRSAARMLMSGLRAGYTKLIAFAAALQSPEPPQGEAADPDPNADGPAERAHRQDEARRMK